MKFSKLLFLFALCLHLCVLAQAQKSPIRFAIEGGTFFSFTGLNVSLASTIILGDHEFYLGPKWVLSDTYLLNRGPWGIDLGYRWNMVQRNKIQGFANLEYQAAFLRPAGNGSKTVVQEMHGAYGLQWKLSDKLKIGNSIGLGGVVEKSKLLNGTTYRLDGFSFLFKLFLNYRLERSPKDK